MKLFFLCFNCIARKSRYLSFGGSIQCLLIHLGFIIVYLMNIMLRPCLLKKDKKEKSPEEP
nr:hypothetical protein Iba_chr11cCG1200 [Ipomoea batatas]GMD54758.1 hypothetical protein Iba_chr11dCG1450 [Ipomoea batatas]GMD56228.1 hypothetical protein Iba_chr11eCG1180 [Ipomoea batatas]